MKALYTMVNRIGRFTYPIYFYANELKIKATPRLTANTWPTKSLSPYATI